MKKAAGIADMPDADYRHMICVEVAAVDSPIELAHEEALASAPITK